VSIISALGASVKQNPRKIDRPSGAFPDDLLVREVDRSQPATKAAVALLGDTHDIGVGEKVPGLPVTQHSDKASLFFVRHATIIP